MKNKKLVQTLTIFLGISFVKMLSKISGTNGINDVKNQYPYIVLLADKPTKSGGKGSCSGSLLNPYWVLTAGHCVDPGPPKVVTRYRNYTKYVNANDGVYFRRVLRAFTPPGYAKTKDQLKNDIALIHIEKYPSPLYATLQTKPVKDAVGTKVTHSGFVRTAPWLSFESALKNKRSVTEIIRTSKGKIVQCIFKTVVPQLCVQPDIPEDWNLTKVRGTNPGDSGGPCFVDNKIAGVVSGHFYGNTTTMSSFTPVESFLKWMGTIMDTDSGPKILILNKKFRSSKTKEPSLIVGEKFGHFRSQKPSPIDSIGKSNKALLNENAVKNLSSLVASGVADVENQYPYVVIVTDAGRTGPCSGSLLNPYWVLTAGHCLDPDPPKIVTRYRNYTKYLKAKNGHYFSRVLQAFPAPGYASTDYDIKNDIALLHIEKHPSPQYATLKTESVQDMFGTEVSYAGFGKTTPWMQSLPVPKNTMDYPKVLQIGFGKIINCTSDNVSPQLCIGPNIPENWDLANMQTTRPGDSGGPCFVDKNKIVGVVTGHAHGDTNPTASFTPVASFLEWMKHVMDINSRPELLHKNIGSNKYSNVDISGLSQKHCLLAIN